jgi:hypothetical protein
MKQFIGKIFLVLFFSMISINGFSQDYSRYKAQNFAEISGNPVYLMLCDNSNNFIFSDNRWAYRLNQSSFFVFSTNSTQSETLRRAKENNDIIILLYQRKGNFVDPNKYGNSQQDQLRLLNDIEKSYTFSADEIITYSSLFNNISESIKQQLLQEERSRDNGWKIWNSFKMDGKNGATTYIQRRTNEIQLAGIAASEQRAEQERMAATEAQTRQNERNEARERSRLLTRSTVMGGYKPCIGTGNEFSTDYEKIVVFGYILNDRISDMNNPTLNRDIRLVTSTSMRQMFREIGSRSGSSSQSYDCIFFLTKSERNEYILNDYILYGDLINKDPSSVFTNNYNNTVIDEWILKNID